MSATKPTPVPGRSVRLGRIVMTQAADQALSNYNFAKLTFRHGSGDWGDLDPEDWQANEDVMTDPEHQGRLLSSYKDVNFDDGSTGTVWIITDSPESDSAITTVLLPEDY